MGKIYTFIHKGQQNSKCKTVDLSLFLENGWEIGNWNQEELNVRSGAAVKKSFDKMKENGTWDEWNSNRGKKVSKGLSKFWEIATEEYILSREEKKQASRDNWTDEEKELYHNKMSESAKLDRAQTSPEEYHRRSLIATKTKKKNGTMNTSSFEDESYLELCKSYGSSDVIHVYNKDNRYPFNCDFYIKSLDLFIELNIHPSHGGHHFDSNSKQDLRILEELQNKNDDWSNMIIDVWTNRDVKKYKCAINNNLNYLCIYNNEYNNFISLVKEKRLCELVS